MTKISTESCTSHQNLNIQILYFYAFPQVHKSTDSVLLCIFLKSIKVQILYFYAFWENAQKYNDSVLFVVTCVAPFIKNLWILCLYVDVDAVVCEFWMCSSVCDWLGVWRAWLCFLLRTCAARYGSLPLPVGSLRMCMCQPINQPINHSILQNPLINQSITQSINRPSINHSISQSTSHLINQPTNQSNPILSKPVQSKQITNPIQYNPSQASPILQASPIHANPTQASPIKSDPIQAKPVQSKLIQSK